MEIVKTTIGFRGMAGAGMTAADREELVSLRQGLTSSLAFLTALTARVEAVEAGGAPVDPVDPVEFSRIATTAADVLAGDGHSLVDAWIHSGPWPSDQRSIRNGLMDPDSFDPDGPDAHIIKSTIPGSSLSWRLGHNEQGQISVFCADPSACQEVTTTEAGPVFMVGNAAMETQMKDTLASLVEFCELARSRGNVGDGARVNLWTIWPQLDGWVGHPTWGSTWGQLGGFSQCLPEYGRSFKFMADYIEWKLGMKLHIFPGHLWWARVYDDVQAGIVPGVTEFSELFHPGDIDIAPNRPIHPAHATAGYGLSCLAFTCHYQRNLTEEADVYIPPAWTETSVSGSFEWPAVSPEFAAYCWRIAWEIATAYGPAGMGGTDGLALEFDGTVDLDPLAPPDPVEPGEGDVPADFVLDLSAGGYTGPALTGTMPTVSGNHLLLTGEAQRGDLALSAGFYAVMIFRLGSEQMSGTGEFLMTSPNLSSWQKPMAYARLTPHVDGPQIHVMSEIDGAPWPEGLDLGREPYGQWVFFQGWVSGDAFGGRRGENGEATGPNPSGPVTATAQIQLFENVICDLGHLRIYDRIPTPGERGAITAWALARTAQLS